MNEQKENRPDLEVKLQERQRVLDILCDFIRIAIDDNMHVTTSKKGNMRQVFGSNVISDIACVIDGGYISVTIGNNGITISICRMMLGDVKVTASRTQYGAIRMCSYDFSQNEWNNVRQALYTVAIATIKAIVLSTGVEVCKSDIEPLINSSGEGVYIGLYRGETETTKFLEEK